MTSPALPFERFRRALDQPARETLSLASASGARCVAPALLGVSLFAGATVLAGALGTEVQLGVAQDAVEALAFVMPATCILAAYLGLRASFRALVGAAALGTFTAGVVCASLVPLIAWVAVLTPAAGIVRPLFVLLLPAVFLGGTMGTFARIVLVFDGRERSAWTLRAAALVVFALFALRLPAGALWVGGAR